MNVLVSAPSMYRGVPFLPYIYGLLRQGCDQNEILKQQLHWLFPLYLTQNTAEEALAPYRDQQIDVLALSCYEWNWDFQVDLARAVKKNNPNCTVVLGGPQPDWKSENFFKTNSWADYVIKGEGELPFAQLMHDLLIAKDYAEIKIEGLWSKENFYSHEAQQVVKFKYKDNDITSPYLIYADVFSRIAEEINSNPKLGGSWANWETARGCPYSCTFCDWGSATFSKIRKVPAERLTAECEWFGQNKVDTIYITDANYGISESDFLTSEMLAKTKLKYGFPKTVFFNSAKNNPERLKKIISVLNNAGQLNYCIQNNLQSTQEDVLAAMKRINVGETKQREFIKDLSEMGFPLGSALIMGSPGESKESFRKSLFDTFEWGMHSETRVFNWALLPNAPAAQPDYVEKYQIKTVVRPTIRNVDFKSNLKHRYGGRSEYLISHSQLTSSEWVENCIFSAFVLCMHNVGLTKFISLYLRHTQKLDFKVFYTELFQDFFKRNPQIFTHLEAHFYNFVTNEDAIINMEIEPSVDMLVDPESWLFLHISKEKENFYQSIKELISNWISASEEVEDVIKYNKEIIIFPDYNLAEGKYFNSKFLWPVYFDELFKSSDLFQPSKPQASRTNYTIQATSTGPYNQVQLDFKDVTSFVQSVLGYKSSRHKRSYFHNFKFEC